jgi:hypothetical protein
MSLETEFKKAYEENIILINAKLSQASKLLGEAITIAEEHGIPFESNISELGQTYTPESFKEKWNLGKRDPVLVDLGIYIDEYACGWEHSAVC